MVRHARPAAPKLKAIDARLADIVAVCEPRFHVWDQAVSAYVRGYKPADRDIERQLAQKEVIGAGNALSELLTVFSEVDPPRDRWTQLGYCPNFLGLSAWTRSERLGVDFHFGIDIAQGMYLSAELVSPAPLWRMCDNFWWLLAGMVEFGDLRFQRTGCPSPPIDEHVVRRLGQSRSGVFSLLSSYVMFQSEDSDEEPDLGTIEVYWPGRTEWPEVLRCGAECFRRLYRMNSLIYRLSHSGANAAKRHAEED